MSAYQKPSQKSPFWDSLYIMDIGIAFKVYYGHWNCLLLDSFAGKYNYSGLSLVNGIGQKFQSMALSRATTFPNVRQHPGWNV